MIIKYSDKATKQVRKIADSDPKAIKRIFDKIEKYAENPAGKHDIKALKGKYGTFFRLRIGQYRVIFEIEENKILVYEVKHRQEAYK